MVEIKKMFPFLMLIIFVTLFHSPLLAQAPFRFPPKIKYKVFKNNQPLANAALFYVEDTGISRFQRELSSLRLVVFQESESNFQYLYESQIFSDDHSLYSDSLINSDKITASHVELIQSSNPANIPGYYFSYSTSVNKNSIYLKFPVTQINNICRTTSILSAAQAITDMSKYRELTFNLYSPLFQGEVKYRYKGKEKIKIDGKTIDVDIVSLVNENQEIHRYKIYRAPDGHCIPVSIFFNVTHQGRSLKMIAQELPSCLPVKTLDTWSAVSLDFWNAGNLNSKKANDLENLIQQTVITDIQNNLKEIGSRQNKRFVVDETLHLNTLSQKDVQGLMDIIFDEFLPLPTRIHNVFNKLNLPPHIDILVMGQYINDHRNQWYMIRPIIIVKSAQKILSQNLLLRKDDIISREPSSGKGVLCADAGDYINLKLKRFFSLWQDQGNDDQGVTVEDVYRMIIKHGFFCHSTDYGYQAEVLERLENNEKIHELDSVIATSPENAGKTGHYSYTFRNNRELTRMRIRDKKFVLTTLSVNEKNLSDTIQLYWAPMKAGVTTYSQALELTKRLNLENYQGFSDWRVPTVKELLSISRYDRKRQDFFPFLVSQKSIKIWTSTPLDPLERKRLAFCDKDVYFVIHTMHEGQQHKLQIDISCGSHRCFFIPVRSVHQESLSTNKQLYISNLAFVNMNEKTPLTSGNLSQLLDREIIKGMQMAVNENNLLIINEQSRRMFYSVDNANLLNNIIFDPVLTKAEKVSHIIHQLMEPNHISLMVTGIYLKNSVDDTITLRPMVIYRHSKTNQLKNLQFNAQELLCPDSVQGEQKLCTHAAEQISKAVKELLDQA